MQDFYQVVEALQGEDGEVEHLSGRVHHIAPEGRQGPRRARHRHHARAPREPAPPQQRQQGRGHVARPEVIDLGGPPRLHLWSSHAEAGALSGAYSCVRGTVTLRAAVSTVGRLASKFGY